MRTPRSPCSLSRTTPASTQTSAVLVFSKLLLAAVCQPCSFGLCSLLACGDACCRYYHSQYDASGGQTQDDAVAAKLCAVATLAARTLWASAGGANTTTRAIRADCDVVSQRATEPTF